MADQTAPRLRSWLKRLITSRDEATLERQPAQPRATPPPEVEVEVEKTNLGPVMDELVAELRRRQRPVGLDPDYDLLRDNFDHLNFALQAAAQNGINRNDPISAHLRNGANVVNNPDINFSMAAYLERYPEKRATQEKSPYLEWLKFGKDAGCIADPTPCIEDAAHVLGMTSGQLADLMSERRTDLQQRLRTGKLGEMFAKASEVEPIVAAAWPEMSRPELLPFASPVSVGQLSALYRCQEEAGFRRARVVIVVNRPRWGGGRRMEGHIAHALNGAISPDEIVVIHTEESGATPPGRYPDGVREIDFAAHANRLKGEFAEHTLAMLLRSFRADAIVNVNSGTFYRALRTYGRALAATERVFLCQFCNEQSEFGNWYGWPATYFYRLVEQVEGVITDSLHLADELERTYLLDPATRDKIRVFRAPVDPALRPVADRSATPPDRRPQVFWAGRWDRQKRIDVVLEIARQMPEVDFRMYGEAVLQTTGVNQVPANVKLEGKYAHITDLDLTEADAWLYTSAWDGVPSLLLEVAMLGVPMVGTLTGGTGEVLQDGLAWPIPEHEGAEAYVIALEEVLGDPDVSRTRAASLRERLAEERTADAFAMQAVGSLLIERDSRNGETGQGGPW